MFASLSKPRSLKQHRIIHMKVLALIVIAVLFWSSDDARKFTADGLNNAAEIISPDTPNKINISF
jgi:hypothetical protein